MVQFMSQSDFNAGGPYAGGAGSASSGIAKLGEVLAQAPMVRAKAGYYGSEAEHARAQTEQLRQQMGVAKGRQDRVTEAMAILSNPQALSDPAAIARLHAIALVDPDIAQHATGIIGGLLAARGLQNEKAQRDADAYNASTGHATYGGTKTGQGAELANRTGNIVVTGQQQRQTDDNQIVQAIPPNAPPGAQPQSMSRGEAKSRGWTALPDQAVTTNVGPATVLPAGGGPPAITSTGAAQRGGQQPVLPSDTVQGVTGQDTFFPRGPGAPAAAPPPAAQPPPPSTANVPPPPGQQGENDTSPATSNTAQNQPPPNQQDGNSINLARAETDSEDDTDQQPAPGSDLAAMMSGVKTAQNQPSANVPGAVAAAGPAAGTPPAPQAAPPPPQPPSAPVSTTAAPSPVAQPQPANTAQPQGGLGSTFQDEQLKRAQQVGATWRALKGEPPVVPPVSKLDPKGELDFGSLIDQSAADQYPQDQRNWHPGQPSEWGPNARNAINQRAHELYTSLGSPARENPGMAIQMAVKELQDKGQIPPPGYRPSAGAIPFVQSLGYGHNVVELQPPRGQGPGQGQGGPGQGGPGQGAAGAPQGPQGPPNQPPAQPAAAPAAQNQPTTATNAKTGQRYVLVNGQWVEIKTDNQPSQVNAQGQ